MVGIWWLFQLQCIIQWLRHNRRRVNHDDVIKWIHFPRYWPFLRGNTPGTSELPSQRPVTRIFDVFFDLRLNKRLNKQSQGWWFATPSPSLCNAYCNYECSPWKNIEQVSLYGIQQKLEIYILVYRYNIPNMAKNIVSSIYLLQLVLAAINKMMETIFLDKSVSETTKLSVIFGEKIIVEGWLRSRQR